MSSTSSRLCRKAGRKDKLRYGYRIFANLPQRLEKLGGKSHIHIYPLYILAERPLVCLSVNIGELDEDQQAYGLLARML
jgi:hypothetical protein